MELLSVTFDFDEVGKIIKVNWSDGTWDEWTYHTLNKQEAKLHALGKLSKAIVRRIGKEDLKKQSDGSVYKMTYNDEGTFIKEVLL
jgi:hypothetical protein